MAVENLSPYQEIALLIQITVEQQGVLRFQNWQEQDYFYQGEPYQYIEFDGVAVSGSGLGLGSLGRTVRIVNRDNSVDTINPVRNWLNSFDGWRGANVLLTQIWPNDLSAQPVIERHQIFKSDIKGEGVGLTLKDPADGTNATIPAQYLTAALAPELPNAAPR